MLVLSRKDGERILVNNGEMTITLIKSRNGVAKIGIEASKDKYTIHREEIQKLINATPPDSEVVIDESVIAEAIASVNADKDHSGQES